MVIRCYAHLLEEFDSDVEKVSKYAAQIGDACLKGGYLTRQLPSFSRKQVAEPAFLDLNLVVKEMGRMLLRLLGEDIEPVQIFRRTTRHGARRSQPDGTNHHEFSGERQRCHAERQPSHH